MVMLFTSESYGFLRGQITEMLQASNHINIIILPQEVNERMVL